MKRLSNLAALALAALVSVPLGAAAQDVPALPTDPPTPSSPNAPFAKLAADFGLTTLASSTGAKDKSQLQLFYVGPGETKTKWTRKMTVDILKVKPATTTAATRIIVSRLKARLKTEGAHVSEFVPQLSPPVGAYFRATTKFESDAGIAYSPATGYVAVIQVSVNGNKQSVAEDAAALRKVLATQAH